MKNLISKCCGAEIEKGHTEYKEWTKCSKCGKDCDIVSIDDEEYEKLGRMMKKRNEEGSHIRFFQQNQDGKIYYSDLNKEKVTITKDNLKQLLDSIISSISEKKENQMIIGTPFGMMKVIIKKGQNDIYLGNVESINWFKDLLLRRKKFGKGEVCPICGTPSEVICRCEVGKFRNNN